MLMRLRENVDGVLTRKQIKKSEGYVPANQQTRRRVHARIHKVRTCERRRLGAHARVRSRGGDGRQWMSRRQMVVGGRLKAPEENSMITKRNEMKCKFFAGCG